MLQEDYQIRLDSFHGPLDLLLYLIRRAEVDVSEIPIAEITDQYLASLSQIDDIDFDHAGEFLVMAATLVEIKSRTIAPPVHADEQGDEASGETTGESESVDPRFELIQQLLAYQRYRVAADQLEHRRDEFNQRYVSRPGRLPRNDPRRGVAETDEPDELDLEDVHLLDLSESYGRIAASIDFDRMGDHLVELDDTPVELYQEDLLDRLTRSTGRRLVLQDVFSGHNQSQRIGLFLATLELVRLRRVDVLQPALESAIEVVLAEDD